MKLRVGRVLVALMWVVLMVCSLAEHDWSEALAQFIILLGLHYIWTLEDTIDHIKNVVDDELRRRGVLPTSKEV